MAHTFGNASASASASTNPVVSATFTPTAGSTCLVAVLCVTGATNRAGAAPTYAGTTMTQASTTQKAAASPECSLEVWYVTGTAAATAGTLSIPNTGTLAIFYVLATGKAGSGMGSAFDVAGGGNNTSTNPSVALASATTVNGDIVFAAIANGAQTWAPSARTGTQIHDTDTGGFGYGTQYLLQATAGAQTMAWTFGTSEDWGAVAVAFKEVRRLQLPTDVGASAVTGSAATLNKVGTGPTIPVLLATFRRRRAV